jgi:hypothetical protein
LRSRDFLPSCSHLTAALYSVLRLFGCRQLDTALFTTLAAVSASSVFFLTIPETYVYGSLTILLALGMVLLTRERLLHPFWFVVMSAMTLSMTVTNWMVTSNFATLEKSFQITVNAFASSPSCGAEDHFPQCPILYRRPRGDTVHQSSGVGRATLFRKVVSLPHDGNARDQDRRKGPQDTRQG